MTIEFCCPFNVAITKTKRVKKGQALFVLPQN